MRHLTAYAVSLSDSPVILQFSPNRTHLYAGVKNRCRAVIRHRLACPYFRKERMEDPCLNSMQKNKLNLIIREETPADYRATELMTMRAFWNLHGPGCSEHYLLHRLRESDDYLPHISRVAELDGKIVGCIAYSKAFIRNKDKTYPVATFGPLAVDPMAQHLGVGARLLQETIALAREAGCPGICIFGEPDYYPKHGFVTCDHFGITDAEGNNFDAFMGYELQENAFSKIQGSFHESDIFAACDDAEALKQFNRAFPFYPELTLSCQWLHRERLGRICSIQKNSYRIQYWEASLPARLKGSFYQKGREFPVVGDYVTFDYNPHGDSTILDVCERTGVLRRPFPADHSMKNAADQVMAANVDAVFIVSSLNDNFNANRIARYIAVAVSGSAVPVVVLTKADLSPDPQPYISQVRALSDQVHVHAVSAAEGTGLDALRQYLAPGKTAAFFGSSGVGKSTLINALCGSEIMKTGEIREKDDRGRHTTTVRQLITLESGVTLIDTPGMRELGNTDAGAGIEDTFSDIEELICQCRFRDCSHRTEPGCAVRRAIGDGTLDPARFALYRSLTDENRRNMNRKAVSKQLKEMKKHGRIRRQP